MKPDNACPVCERPFGMTRHYYGRQSFCSAKCIARFKSSWDRYKAYLKWLFDPP